MHGAPRVRDHRTMKQYTSKRAAAGGGGNDGRSSLGRRLFAVFGVIVTAIESSSRLLLRVSMCPAVSRIVPVNRRLRAPGAGRDPGEKPALNPFGEPDREPGAALDRGGERLVARRLLGPVGEAGSAMLGLVGAEFFKRLA